MDTTFCRGITFFLYLLSMRQATPQTGWYRPPTVRDGKYTGGSPHHTFPPATAPLPTPPHPLTSQLRERAPTLTDSRGARARRGGMGGAYVARADRRAVPTLRRLPEGARPAPAPLPLSRAAAQGVTRQCGRDARQALRAGEVVVVDFVGKNGDKVRDRCGCGCWGGYCCYCCFCCCGFF